MNILGVGVDVESVDSFRKKKFFRHQRFYRRLFSDREIEYCRSFRDPAPRFAARFCAKEAFLKAARSYFPLQISHCEVQNTPEGAPFLQPRNPDKKLGRFFQQHEVWLSLSHTDDLAMAFVVLGKKSKAQRRS